MRYRFECHVVLAGNFVTFCQALHRCLQVWHMPSVHLHPAPVDPSVTVLMLAFVPATTACDPEASPEQAYFARCISVPHACFAYHWSPGCL